MENQHDPEKDLPPDQEGESRREFIKKLPYIAPVIQTFLLSETAFASDRRGGEGEDDQGNTNDTQGDNNDNQGDDSADTSGRRRRRQVSPHTRGRSRGRG